MSFPLASTTWDAAEIAAMQEVIASGRFTMGERVRAFEESFAAFFGARYGVMVNSGSSANLVAVAALCHRREAPLRPGDEVIVPAVSWSTSFYPFHQYGLRLRFVDVEAATLNLDPALAEAAITPRTRAILAVNLLGAPCDFRRLRALCERHGLLLLEDNCESMGATAEGRFCGTFGAVGTFSTFFSHHISTMEGGVVLTDDEELYQLMVSLRAHGWTRELPDRNLVFDKSGDPFEDSFRFVLPGYNLRPLELSGAIGIEQLRKLPRLLETRRANAHRFVELFGERDDVEIQRPVGESSWFGFSLLLRGPLAGRRREVVAALAARNIECRPIVAGNFCANPVMRRMNAEIASPLTVAERIHRDGLFVGNHHYDLASELALLAEAMAR